MTNKTLVTAEQARHLITEEIDGLYRHLESGNDVSPGRRFRLEGKIELLLGLGILDKAWLTGFIEMSYEKYFRQPLDPLYWQWQSESAVFCLPLKMQDAPVYKS